MLQLKIFQIKALTLMFCFSIIVQSHIYSQNLSWIDQAGGIGDGDFSTDIAVDNAGNVIIVGSFEGTVAFNGTTYNAVGLDDSGPTDFFVAKFDALGNLQWLDHAGGIVNSQTNESGTNRIQYVTIDNDNNIIITGHYIGSPILSGVTLPSGGGNEEFFIAKYDPNGNLIWVRTGLGNYQVYGFSITTDENNNVYATGMYAHHNLGGYVNFDGIILNTAGGRDIFIVKYDSHGTVQWARSAGSSTAGQNESGQSIIYDGLGNIIITGFFVGNATFSSISINSSGGRDAFIAKYNTSGTIQWAKNIGGIGTDSGGGISCDALGNVYVSGNFENTVNFGNSILTSLGGTDIFVAKFLYPDGINVWATRAGGTSSDGGNTLVTDSDGNSYVLGSFRNIADFGDNILSSEGAEDIFLAKCNSAGTFTWANSSGGTGSDSGVGIALGSSNNSYITGIFSDMAEFGSINLSSNGAQDIFYGEFGFTILPVELLTFEANQQQAEIYLQWKTGIETNNYGFEIQWTADKNFGKKFWEKIGFVNGHNNSSTEQEYSYVHSTPSSGINYYRLKQLDFDGHIDYSNIINIALSPLQLQDNFCISPNPTPDKLLISIEEPSNKHIDSYEIVNQFGQTILQFQQKLPMEIDVSNLPPGMYQLVLRKNGAIIGMKQFVKI